MFTIGDFALLTGVSPKRLRHYDQIGLFNPVWVDPHTRYRYYSASQIPELRRIAALIDLGIPLRRMLALRDGGGSLHDELLRRRAELEAERRTLEQRLGSLDIQLERSGEVDVVVRRRPPGRWASLRAEVAPGEDLAPLFVEVEEYVQRWDARAAQPPVCVVHDRDAGRRVIELLIPVDRRIPSSDRLRAVATPEAVVASSLVVGGYEALGTAEGALRAWAAATGREVTAAPWYVYLRFSAEDHLKLPEQYLTGDRAELVTEVLVEVAG